MNKFMILSMVILFSGTLFLMCGCSEENDLISSNSNNDIYVENDLGQYKSPGGNIPVSVSVKIGETVKITLESNPTTGYQWTAEVDTEFMNILKDGFTPDSGLLGAGGTQEFEFQALKAGKTQLVMKYGRSWESSPINVYNVTANIASK
jgi:inhibitor of cysteine peptidase